MTTKFKQNWIYFSSVQDMETFLHVR